MGNILDQIVANKKKEIKRAKKSTPISLLESKINTLSPTLDFRMSIHSSHPQIIAEVKKASPSRGILCPDFNPAWLAGIYENNGASAISVLTETQYFQGSLQHLTTIRDTVKLPLLRKDFILEPYQIYESRISGADAVLLIGSILSKEQLRELLSVSYSLDMQCLVEVHSETEIKIALECDAKIIGINNRNLGTLNIDTHTTLNLRPLIPEGITVVSESGIKTNEDVKRIKECNINAILIGEALVTSNNIGNSLREIKSLLA